MERINHWRGVALEVVQREEMDSPVPGSNTNLFATMMNEFERATLVPSARECCG